MFGVPDTYIKVSPSGSADELIKVVNSAGTTDGTDDAGAIKLSAAAGGIGLAWADTKDLWAEGGSFIVTANQDEASCIKLHADAGDAQTITIVNDEGETANAIDIDATAGGIDIDAAGAISIDSSAGSIDINVVDGQTVKLGLAGGVEQIIAPHGTPGSEKYSVINTAGTTDGGPAGFMGLLDAAILLTSSAGGIGLGWADGKDLWAEGGSFIVTANQDEASCIKLHADAGTSQTVTITNDAGTVDGSNDDTGSPATLGAINIEATAGGIGIGWADTKDLWAEGGQIMMVANHDTADAIKLHADAGTSQTITLLNDAGTAADAIELTSTAGGVALTAHSGSAIALTAGAISHVHDFATTQPLTIAAYNTGGEYGGTVMKYSPGANDTLTVGGLYFLHTDGTWNQTDANAVATGASQMLGIGLGNARTAGVLIKGFVRIPSTEILNVPGSNASPGLPLYVSTTAGHLDFTAPSATDDFLRIVGYAIQDSTDVLIYFDPDKTWVEMS
jgi:hypothetical protein